MVSLKKRGGLILMLLGLRFLYRRGCKLCREWNEWLEKLLQP